ncbi:hypothetical protein DL98DRAFT_595308 [Cadophora sp. DSE1049]|nr:hypothetical protein DL98DRAFT_595308 [Cadophora sp. DSE1049]
MSYCYPEVGGTTSQNQDAFHQLSPRQKLETEVIQRAPQQCDHDFSTPRLTDRWKNFWNEKICVLWLRAEGKDWPDIIQWFEEKGIKKDYDSLRKEWSRVSQEVTAMYRAAKKYEANWSLEDEAASPWDQISASMKEFGAEDSWTPDKVRYAWHRGVSAYLSDVFIMCPDKLTPAQHFRQ